MLRSIPLLRGFNKIKCVKFLIVESHNSYIISWTSIISPSCTSSLIVTGITPVLCLVPIYTPGVTKTNNGMIDEVNTTCLLPKIPRVMELEKCEDGLVDAWTYGLNKYQINKCTYPILFLHKSLAGRKFYQPTLFWLSALSKLFTLLRYRSKSFFIPRRRNSTWSTQYFWLVWVVWGFTLL